MLREKLGVSKTIQLTETVVAAIQRTADTLATSFTENIRACVASERRKLDARERKRKRAQEMGRNSA